MEGILLLLLAVLTVVFLVLLLVTATRRRRRAPASRSLSVSMADPVGRREIVDTVLASARRSHGRHSAPPTVPAGAMLLLLVPIAAKRRRRPLDISSQFMSMPTDSMDQIALIQQQPGREFDPPAIAPPADAAASSDDRDAISAAAEDIHIYRRRVNATVQAISRRMGPGESPELVGARMLAAVDRLEGPIGFARPRLSPSGAQPSWPQLEQTAPVASPVDPPRAVQNTSPLEDSEPGEVRYVGAASEDEEEVVLPVPPMEISNDTRRRGLRRRGKAV